jgi:crossover junction endodeoxyribonuclease RuvC
MGLTIKNKGALKSKGVSVGLDVSTDTGIVVLSPEGKVITAVEMSVGDLKKGASLQDRIGRVKKLYKSMSEFLEPVSPALVVIEAYGFARYNAQIAVELGTVVRLSCLELGLPFLEVSPLTLKKFAIGKGKGDKSLVRLAAFKKWKFEHDSDNVVDAYVLAQLGRLCLGLSSAKNQSEREVLKTVLQRNITKVK